MRTVRKAMAYITRGDELLIFRHAEFPEAGLQVPGGTIEPDEDPAVAVMREALEETGLEDLRMVRFLGEQVRDMRDIGRDELAHRYFYELAVETAQETWRWYEETPAEGGERIAYDLYWVPIAAVPPLITEHDFYVKELRRGT